MPVNSLKSILAALPDQRGALQKYARANRLKFKEERREEAATALLRCYTTLAPQRIFRSFSLRAILTS